MSSLPSSEASAKNFSDEQLLAFLGNRIDEETGRAIREQMGITGSQVQKWFANLKTECGDPYNVDWWQLIEPPNSHRE